MTFVDIGVGSEAKDGFWTYTLAMISLLAVISIATGVAVAVNKYG
jgi:hypothetical protein